MAAGMTKHHRRALPGGLSHSLQFPELIFCFQHSCGYRSHLILGPEPRCLLLVLIDPHPESLPPLIASPAQPSPSPTSAHIVPLERIQGKCTAMFPPPNSIP